MIMMITKERINVKKTRERQKYKKNNLKMTKNKPKTKFDT